MKIYSSLKSKKVRDKDCRLVRRKGRVYVTTRRTQKLKAQARVNSDEIFEKLKTCLIQAGFFNAAPNRHINMKTLFAAARQKNAEFGAFSVKTTWSFIPHKPYAACLYALFCRAENRP